MVGTGWETTVNMFMVYIYICEQTSSISVYGAPILRELVTPAIHTGEFYFRGGGGFSWNLFGTLPHVRFVWFCLCMVWVSLVFRAFFFFFRNGENRYRNQYI